MALPGEEPEFMNLREWDRRARFIRENPTSRRFSASYVGSFREDYHKSSSRINVNNISSTASSPGYSLKEEIDPSTYSFTNALKSLQAKSMFNKRDWLTQEGFALNSKWNEAEKYICNPLSGEVPMECLSSKTLRARSFRNLTTMSAPLHCPIPNPLTKIGQNKTNNNNNNPNVRVIHEDLYALDPVLVRAEEKVVGLKRDVGIKSTWVDSSSGSPSPAETPPIMERSLKRYVEANDLLVDFNLKLECQPEDLKLAEDEKEEEKHEMSKKEEEKQEMSKEEEDKQEMTKEKGEEEQKKSEEEQQMEKNKKRGSGCFPWNMIRPHVELSDFKHERRSGSYPNSIIIVVDTISDEIQVSPSVRVDISLPSYLGRHHIRRLIQDQLINRRVTITVKITPSPLKEEVLTRMVQLGKMSKEELKTSKMETEPCSICLDSFVSGKHGVKGSRN